jgi:DNA-binding CsgD family transcriptional regulator
LPIDDRQLCILGIHRSRRRPDYDAADQRLLTLLIPHLERALQLRNRIASIRQEGRLGLAALDALTVAVAIVTETGGVLHVNAAAERIAAEREGVLIAGKQLAASDPTAACALRRLIRGAAATSAGMPGSAGGSLAAPRRSGKRPLNLLVAPLPAGRLADALQNPCAAVFILDPEAGVTLRAEALAQLYGLSAAEARVMIELGSGLSIEEIAEAHGVSRNTVRTQLRQIFEKTGTRRQAEAAALVARLGLISR